MKEIEITTKNVQAVFWKRVLAYIVDLFIIDFIIIYPFNRFFSGTDIISSYNDKVILIAFAILILSLAYFVLFEWKIRQTVGKMLLNLYIASKNELTFSQALTRNITKPFPAVLLIDVLYMFFKHENQRLFEKLSETNVMETRFVIRSVEKGMEKQ